MKTSKSISTIHYIDETNLRLRLQPLVEKNKISFFVFGKHLKEDDETKDHIHLFIIPNGKLDTDQLREELEFLDPKNPTMPIRSLPFSTSKFADWYLYVLHDSAYLASKMQTRKYHYSKDELYTSDSDYLNELIHQIDYTRFKTQKMVTDMAKEGVPFGDIVAQGVVPVPLINQYSKLYDVIRNNELRRLRQTHDNVNPDTGEFIESSPPSDVVVNNFPWE